MNIEKMVMDTVNEKLHDGTLEKIVSKSLEECVKSAVEGAFSYNSPVKKALEAKLNEVFTPAIAAYDFGAYLVKLNDVLSEIVAQTNLSDNAKILDNFKNLMVEPEKTKITMSEIIKQWHKYVADNVNTDGLEVEYDDGPRYESVGCEVCVEDDDSPSWLNSSFEHRRVTFECEHDENVNFMFTLTRWKKQKHYTVQKSGNGCDLMSLRYMSDFEVFVTMLQRAGTEITLDVDCDDDCMTPSKEPELSYS